MLKRLVYFSVLLFGYTFAQLPEMKIIGQPQIAPEERIVRKDRNGEYCAAIKVQSNLKGLAYESGNGHVGDILRQPGVDIVYLTTTERWLRILHDEHNALRIILDDIGIQLKSGECWKIEIQGQAKTGDVLPVTIFAQPEDARIIVDGKPAQSGKPVELSKGSHRLHIEKQGYKTLDEQIQVSKDNVVFNKTLQEVELQQVQIKSVPTDAQIIVDGVEKGVTDRGLFLYPASYQLKLQKTGYVEINETITVREGATNVFSYNLNKNSATLTLNVNPSDARVLINKEDYSGKSNVELAPGQYKIEISKAGYYDQSETMTIARGETPRKNYTLIAKTGKLQFNVQPLEAKVTLKQNGRTVETWQGMKLLNSLPVGSYDVECSANGYQSETKPVNISEGKTAVLDIAMRKDTGRDVSQYAPPGGTTNDNMVFVEGGTFQMGSNDGDSDEKPVHTVTVGSFYMGKYEVTQKEWVAVMGSNPSKWKGDNLPVEGVSWDDVQEFIRKLNAQTGRSYRLPTEAEWEYACRGGSRSAQYKYSGSDNADAVAWYGDNSGSKTHAVGQKQPNELGLYDMSGNVWEWCQDWYGNYESYAQNNPQGPVSGTYRVLRGGSWNDDVNDLRSANRGGNEPGGGHNGFGFRCVRSR